MIGIGARLKQIRTDLEMDQVAFADSLGISSRDTIYRWEKEASYPQADILHAINDKYGISVQWLVTGKGPMRDDQAGLPVQFWAQIQPGDEFMDLDLFGFLHSKDIARKEFVEHIENQHWIDIHCLLYVLLKKASIPELQLIQHSIQSWIQRKNDQRQKEHSAKKSAEP